MGSSLLVGLHTLHGWLWAENLPMLPDFPHRVISSRFSCQLTKYYILPHHWSMARSTKMREGVRNPVGIQAQPPLQPLGLLKGLFAMHGQSKSFISRPSKDAWVVKTFATSFGRSSYSFVEFDPRLLAKMFASTCPFAAFWGQKLHFVLGEKHGPFS